MTDAWAMVLAAAIPVLGTGVGFLIRELRSFRTENRSDHAVVMKELNKVQEGISKVSERLSSHIDWHMDKGKKS
jgi:hypothetical protein